MIGDLHGEEGGLITKELHHDYIIIAFFVKMFEEDVEVCNEPLTKVCNNDTVGQGETVCNTHYETVCETR